MATPQTWWHTVIFHLFYSPARKRPRMEYFQHTHADACEWPILEEWGLAQKVGRQVLPGQHQMDGFTTPE